MSEYLVVEEQIVQGRRAKKSKSSYQNNNYNTMSSHCQTSTRLSNDGMMDAGEIRNNFSPKSDSSMTERASCTS